MGADEHAKILKRVETITRDLPAAEQVVVVEALLERARSRVKSAADDIRTSLDGVPEPSPFDRWRKSVAGGTRSL